METRKLDEIVWRADLYPRLKPDASTIQRYADDLDVLPPIEVNQDNILIDGYHRWQAHQQAGADTIPVIVTTTPNEAELLRLAIARNATHGRQLSAADKRRYAQRWAAELPAAQICATLSISERTLRRWTQEQRGQQDADLNAAITARWLRCESQAAMAAALG
ncbi:MAG TPA: ParB N-terminal domain-containing protein [Anaerolineae bacterium]|nr:ParB N-terminal domain-containing protein [Anaerolineae bacterium]